MHTSENHAIHGHSTNELRLRMKLERAADRTTTLRLPVPMLNAKVLLKLLQLELNERPPQAPVERVHLELIPVEPRTAQHGLFLPLSPEPEKLEITLARIRGLVGAENVGAPELLDTHRTDAFRMTILAHSKGDDPPPQQPKIAFRRFRPGAPGARMVLFARPACASVLTRKRRRGASMRRTVAQCWRLVETGRLGPAGVGRRDREARLVSSVS